MLDAEIPINNAACLPRRVAHAVHALLVASKEQRGPVTTREVCIYDAEALDLAATRRALIRARDLNLIASAGRLWFAREAAHNLRRSLEDRVLAEQERDS